MFELVLDFQGNAECSDFLAKLHLVFREERVLLDLDETFADLEGGFVQIGVELVEPCVHGALEAFFSNLGVCLYIGVFAQLDSPVNDFDDEIVDVFFKRFVSFVEVFDLVQFPDVVAPGPLGMGHGFGVRPSNALVRDNLSGHDDLEK